MLKLIRLLLLTFGFALLAIVMTSYPVKAATVSDNTALTGSKAPVTQSYGTSGTIQEGMIVRLGANDKTKVTPLNQDEEDRMFGVVVAANDAALSLTSDITQRQVYVATYGKYQVLVSTQNGPINPGDFVSVSTIDGIGMKADRDAAMVIGKVLSGFDGKSNVLGTSGLLDGNKSDAEVSLGRVTIQVQVQPNPLQSTALPTAFNNFLSHVGYSLSNKKVSLARMYLALLLLLITTFVSAVLLFSGVKSSISAIGRNPLAKKSIYRGLLQVVISSLILFVVGIFATYLLLKL